MADLDYQERIWTWQEHLAWQMVNAQITYKPEDLMNMLMQQPRPPWWPK
jgi:hypothetical protein